MANVSIALFFLITLLVVTVVFKVTDHSTVKVLNQFQVENLSVGRVSPHKSILKNKVAALAGVISLMILIVVGIM